MIDVHPPHETVHTWRDFLIHIATICVGLLIAIGLEQAVEAFHHVHERRALESEMRTEARRNVEVLHVDIDRNLDKAAWISTILKNLQTAHPAGGIVTIALPSHEEFRPQTYPSRATWAVAKTNGEVALVSESEAKIYDRLDKEAVAEGAAQERENVAYINLQADQVRLGILLQPGAIIKVPVADIPGLAKDLSQEIAVLDDDALRDAFWAGAAKAVAERVRDREDFVPYLKHESSTLSLRIPKP